MHVETGHQNKKRVLTKEFQQERESEKAHTEDVSFAVCRSIVTLTALAVSFCIQYQPKLTVETKYLVTISVAYSLDMPNQYRINLEEREAA